MSIHEIFFDEKYGLDRFIHEYLNYFHPSQHDTDIDRICSCKHNSKEYNIKIDNLYKKSREYIYNITSGKTLTHSQELRNLFYKEDNDGILDFEDYRKIVDD